MVYLILYLIGVLLFPVLLKKAKKAKKINNFLIDPDRYVIEACALALTSLLWPLTVVIILLAIIYKKS